MTQSTMGGLSADKRKLLALLLDDDDDAPGAGRTVVPRADRDSFPLSLMQRRLWLTEQLEPGTALYNIPLALRLSGALDAAALERAFHEVARRHQVLRATFSAGADDAPVQRILSALPATAFRVEDLSALNGHREGALRDRAQAEAALPFSLSEGPLVRAVLLRMAPEDHVLLLTLHHIVGDGWSNGILFRELFALYGAFARGEASPLPELEIQYADFAAWQRERLSGEFLDAELAWWRERLAGAPAVLQLPTDRPRPAVPSRAGAQRSLLVPREVLDAAHALSRASGATLYMTVLAALQVVLGRWSGQDDVLVGSPVAGREHAELEPLVGCFINTVVMRGDLRGDPSFGELLARTREATLGAYAHQEVPFERLVDDLVPARTLAHTPLFQVMLTLQNAPGGSTARTGLTFSAVEREGSASKFDMTVYATERADGLFLSAVYATDLFDGSTVDRLLAQVGEVLRQAAAEPGRLVSAISLADDEERARVVVEWNRTDADLAHDGVLHRMIEAQAARTPDAVAVVYEDESLTYAELDARANQLAQLLHHRGIGPEVRVGVCMERSAQLVVAILAVLKAGGAYVPLDPGYPAERLAHMLADSGVPVLLTVDAIRAKLPEHAAETICLDADAALIAAECADAPECAAEPEHAAYVIYTSGSTGLPKGVVIEHRNIANYVAGVLTRMQATPCASYALVSTVAADLGHTVLFPALCTGAALHVVSESRATNPEAFADYMEAHQVEGMKIVPSHLQALQSGSRPAAVLPRKLLVLGGDGARREWIGKVREMAPEMAILNHYGPTETTVGVLTHAIVDTPERAILPLGTPLPNSRVYVLDARMRVLPVGVPGELYVGGAGVARGYLNRPELTAERFIDSPFVPGDRLYRTGDRVRWLADGTVEFLGRVDDQVKIRGFRVELGEIEAALRQHPRVAAVAVIAREDVPGEKRLAGYVAADGRAPTVAELRAFLLERLPDYMVPAAWAVLDALPLNRNGKVDRHALPAPDAHAAQAAAAQPSAPRTALETALSEVWAEVLRVETVGVNDNFFELGGDSIQAIKVISRLRKRDVKVTSRQLFEHQTIAKLCALLDSAPRTPIEQTLAEVWAEVLRVEKVGVNDNFFELGGDSIQAIKVISRLRKRDVKLTSRQLFEHQTVAALAAVLDTPPVNPAEQTLAEVWAEVLRVEKVGLDDNFFELGGDSILAIKVISRLRKRGIKLTSRQLFEHQTVRTLATVAVAEPGAQAAGAAVAATAPLTPIQRSFFERGLANPNHYNQSMLLRVRDRLNAGAVETALAALLAHHDALRLRFRPAADGGWTQESGAAAAKAPFDTVDLSALPEADRAAAVEAICAERQASLDVAAGALMRAVLFEMGAGEPQRLFVCIHHLAVDGVSWRILLEDLETAVGQLQAGRPVSLGEKTTAFTQWAAKLAEHAAGGALNAEAAYWTDAARVVDLPLPVDGEVAGAPRAVALELTAEETRALLQEVPAAYRTQINDVLLAAVARALGGWTGAGAVRLSMEGHGREELFSGVDLSRTVGWFTSLFPVHLTVPAEHEGPAALLRSVKEQLRAIPGKGVGFGILRWLSADAELRAKLAAVPRPEVVFNYLGQMDGTVGDDALFASTGGRRGPEQAAGAAPAHALEINGAVRGGRLVLVWQFVEGRHTAETVRRVAGACMDALRGLIAHCTSADAGGCTPSDFPLARLSQAQLDRAVGRGGGVEDVYPLSPLQQGILFHTVAAEARDEKPYVVLSSFALRGVDPKAMRAAWQQVIDRHPILRTRLAWEGLPEPHQVVERQVELPWVEEDWRDLPVEAREQKLDRYMKDELERGFDPSVTPLMRCALFRVEDDVYELVRTHHHLVSDGWSTPLLLRDMVQAYAAGVRGERAELRAPRPYADYVAWLGAQDQAKAEAYWRRTLDGFTAPTSLAVDRGAQAAGGPASNQDVQLRLSAPLTTRSGAKLPTTCASCRSYSARASWSLPICQGQHDRRHARIDRSAKRTCFAGGR